MIQFWAPPNRFEDCLDHQGCLSFSVWLAQSEHHNNAAIYRVSPKRSPCFKLTFFSFLVPSLKLLYKFKIIFLGHPVICLDIMIPNGPWALHKDQHPPTSLSNTNTLQKFIMELVTSTFRVCLLILTFLCISASHGFRSGQPWWLRWRRPGGCRQEDDAPLSHLQQGVPKQIQHQGESFKMK